MGQHLRRQPFLKHAASLLLPAKARTDVESEQGGWSTDVMGPREAGGGRPSPVVARRPPIITIRIFAIHHGGPRLQPTPPAAAAPRGQPSQPHRVRQRNHRDRRRRRDPALDISTSYL